MAAGSGKRRNDAFTFDADGSGDADGGLSGHGVVLHPYLKSNIVGHARRTPEARLEEAVRLAEAIDLEIVHADTVKLAAYKPAALFGTGKAEEIGTLVRSLDADVVIIDGSLTPVQQRNLEKVWKVKVIDRTGLILEIFGERAQTKEGSLQVELAHLNYQKSRLVRSWTHLERQRGGLGFVGGPGETQIEADRRIISDRITKLQKQLGTVKRTRDLHRASRKKTPFPIIALVGYTNAGKSTLFNKLTKASVMAEDMLFATLDPTMREVSLPDDQAIILSDTVGFISDLPTQLIASFRATLEEVLEADLILHVRDISHPDSAAQKADVEAVLEDLGVTPERRETMVEVYNKIDLLDEEELQIAKDLAETTGASLVSAVTGEGTTPLLNRVSEFLRQSQTTIEIDLDPSEGKAMAWLYRNATVLDREDKPESTKLTLSITPENLGKYDKEFGRQ